MPAVKITCPRCNTALQVPQKLLGQYTQCPACQNRILIPPHEPAGDLTGSVSDVSVARGAAARPTGAAAATAPRPGTAPASLPNRPVPANGGSGHSAPAAAWSDHAAAEPAPQRKVARFITAESAPSTVHLAPGGELPKLQLTEGAHAVKSGAKASSMNPLVVVGAACLSFCLCIVLLLMDFDSTSVDSGQEADIRMKLESYYKDQEGPLAPYQVFLRDAQQARSRGDRQAEQRQYRKVLDLLHAERDPRDRFRGLTGTPKDDQNLEKLLATLLAGHQAEAPEESN